MAKIFIFLLNLLRDRPLQDWLEGHRGRVSEGEWNEKYWREQIVLTRLFSHLDWIFGFFLPTIFFIMEGPLRHAPVVVLCWIAYEAVCTWIWGRTLGRFGISKIVDEGKEGRNPSFKQALIRSLFKMIFLPASIIAIFFPEKESLHDRLAKTAPIIPAKVSRKWVSGK